MVIFKDTNVVQPGYEVWTINNNTLGLILKNSRKNGKLNNLLGRYPQDTDFSQSDEPLFKIGVHEVAEVSELIGVNLNVFVFNPLKGFRID